MFKDKKIEKKLTKSFLMVSLITAISAILGLIALVVVANRYSYALKIGRASCRERVLAGV